jgi:Fe-S-cluster containining protein
MSHTLRFACTQCGKCCHDLRLPLSIDEAIVWLRDGGEVKIFCEAIPWPDEPPADNLQARHKKGRSFPAHSGELPVRIVATLVASFDGPCPHLQADLRCGAYEWRPRTCRIYPAEANPFIALNPAGKLCPPEAWGADKPVFLIGETLADAGLAHTIAQSREWDVKDLDAKAQVCAALSISTAALANEGYAIHSPAREALLDALKAARVAPRESTAGYAEPMEWGLVSNRSTTRNVLGEIGARVVPESSGILGAMEYLPFYAAD